MVGRLPQGSDIMNMNTNNISRFLYESALYLDIDPAQAFLALGLTGEADTDSGTADDDSDCCPLLLCA